MNLLADNSKIIVAPASFKGSLSAPRAAESMMQGIHDALPGAQAEAVPLSDGGEGLVRVLATAMDASLRTSLVHGPLEDLQVQAEWALTNDGTTAIIEMASAAGLALVPPERRDPGVTSTYGVGELIVEALNAGVSKLVVGLGGSATNDGGAGMAQALGYRFLDDDGHPLPPGGSALRRLHRIDVSGRDARLDRVSVVAPCDVVNILTGPQGAALVYGMQKGGSREALLDLDEALAHFAGIAERDCACVIKNVPGAGAAGGLGGGVIAFLKGKLKRGIETVLDAVRFDERIAGVDVIITGEGRLDTQTLQGKVMQGVLKRARAQSIPVMAVVGSISLPDGVLSSELGFVDVEELVGEGITLSEAMQEAPELLHAKTFLLVSRHTGGRRIA